ncbi:MAG TPA: metallophosphoesterase [Bacteroidales bacterium]|nr:metallophosphoesterase [Bacteroidales bacterium]
MRTIFALLFFAVFSSFLLLRTGSSARKESDQGKPLFSFGVVTDVQYCDCDPADSRFYRSSISKLRAAMKGFRSAKTDFVIDLGDLIDRNFESFRPLMQIFDSSGFRVYHVTGNHDYYIDPKLIRSIPTLKDHKTGYYSVEHKGFRFIFLNGNEVSTYSTHNKKIIDAANTMIGELKKSGEPNGLDHNGALGADQMVWLDDELSAAESSHQKVLLFCHFPVWPVNDHNLLNYRSVLGILGKHHNVIAWFNGHNHSGNYGNLNLTHFVTLKAMCETDAVNSYSVIEVYYNKVWIKGEGREKSQIMAY